MPAGATPSSADVIKMPERDDPSVWRRHEAKDTRARRGLGVPEQRLSDPSMPERAVEYSISDEARHYKRTPGAIRVGTAQQDRTIRRDRERTGDPSDIDLCEAAPARAE